MSVDGRAEVAGDPQTVVGDHDSICRRPGGELVVGLTLKHALAAEACQPVGTGARFNGRRNSLALLTQNLAAASPAQYGKI